MAYNELLRIREKTPGFDVGRVQDWVWIASDNGAWDGPKMDWETTHYDLIRTSVKKFDVVVQAGGNQGMYPRLLSDMFQHVYTFEPDPLNFHCLVGNCQSDNIHKFNAALGASHAMVNVNRHTMENVGCHTVTENADAFTPQLMIDDLELPTCDFIWLDIEGYEYNALLGARRTIDKFKPAVMVERGSDQIASYLLEWGYQIRGTSHADTMYTI